MDAVVEDGVRRRVGLDDEKQRRCEQDPAHAVAGLPTSNDDADERERQADDDRRQVAARGYMSGRSVQRNRQNDQRENDRNSAVAIAGVASLNPGPS